ncbi:hypothetical protein [Halapricum desulfuricans]|nr:hypothetical protein [Halapricum desulfuricans]
MPAATSAIIVVIAFSVVEDEIVRIVMLFVAALELIVTPQVLKRVHT